MKWKRTDEVITDQMSGAEPHYYYDMQFIDSSTINAFLDDVAGSKKSRR